MIHFILFRFFDYFFELIELYVVNLAHSFGIYLYHPLSIRSSFTMYQTCATVVPQANRICENHAFALSIYNPPLYISCTQLAWALLLPRSSKAVADSAELQEECLAALKRATIVPWFGRCGQPGQKMELVALCAAWWEYIWVHVIVQNPLPPFLSLDCEPQDLRRERTWLERRLAISSLMMLQGRCPYHSLPVMSEDPYKSQMYSTWCWWWTWTWLWRLKWWWGRWLLRNMALEWWIEASSLPSELVAHCPWGRWTKALKEWNHHNHQQQQHLQRQQQGQRHHHHHQQQQQQQPQPSPQSNKNMFQNKNLSHSSSRWLFSVLEPPLSSCSDPLTGTGFGYIVLVCTTFMLLVKAKKIETNYSMLA